MSFNAICENRILMKISEFIVVLQVYALNSSLIDPFHIVISLSNRSSIEKSLKLFLKMKGQIAYQNT